MREETKDKKSDEEKTTEKRCFIMMPFSDQGDYPKGHFAKVYEQIFSPAIKNAGYIPYRVDENTISDSIINKIFEGVQNCEMALCDLSNRNPNVLYELGLRQAYNKPVVLVKDEKTENIFDVSVISTVPYNSNRLYENVLEAQEKICESLKATGEGKDTTLLQFVRAKEASYDDVKVNKDDTVNIMLQSIMKELRQLNSSKDTNDIKKYTKREAIEICINNKNDCSQEDVKEIINAINLFNNTNIIVTALDSVKNEIRVKVPIMQYVRAEDTIIEGLESHIGEIKTIREEQYG